ncbi:MAG: DUF3089 domain-containing protein [Prevotella sp.]|nr:DUF3089 domain-containing protein [Prevotella sp.]
MKKVTVAIVVIVLCVVTLLCLTGRQSGVPAEPDYTDSTQWYVRHRQAGADLFYIVSTETADYTLPDGQLCHWADTYSDSLRQPLQREMHGVDRLLSGELNFFAPYYRQCSLETFQSDSLMAERLPMAARDVGRAFSHYIKHLNGGRPFILAGFSQGAFIVLELLREMDDETFSRLIAAYVIGITVPKAEPHILPAQRDDDTGVTICYNSVRDTSCAMPGWERSGIAINPVNWATDATPATLITTPSPRHTAQTQKPDTMTVHLDTATGLLIVRGYTATDYMLPLIGIEGNYHSREIWLYREQLRQNMALRASRKLAGETP